MKQVTKAWAIETRAIDTRAIDIVFIGKFWFSQYRLTNWTSGQKIALFETRDKARNDLPSVKFLYSKARVVRVKVTIETVKEKSR